jgi:hypothetical protein
MLDLHEYDEVILFKLYQISHPVWYLNQTHTDDWQKNQHAYPLTHNHSV